MSEEITSSLHKMAEERYFEITQEVIGYSGTVVHLLRVIEECLKERAALVAPMTWITEDAMSRMLQGLKEAMERTLVILRERQS
jgi:hypothetical protein